MSHEILLQTTSPYEFVTVTDSETSKIYRSDPDELLDNLFRNDPNSVFLMRGSGFKMDRQILRWIDKQQKAVLTNASLPDAQRAFTRETIQDVIGFYFEYLSGQDVFKIDVELKENPETGSKTVYAGRYNSDLREINKKLRETTGIKEREGALEAGIDKAIDIIIESGENTLVLVDSPSGWSGMGFDFPANQTYAYFINSEGNLEGLTIRTDIDLSTAEKLVETQLSQNSNYERIKNVVSTPLPKTAASIDEALDLIEQASGRKFDKQRYELTHRNELFTLNSEASTLIEKLRIYLEENITHLSETNIKLFVIAVGKTILDLHSLTLIDRKERSQISAYRSDYRTNNIKDEMFLYYQLAQEVRQIPGCNGGGQSDSINSLSGAYTLNSTEVFNYFSTDTGWHNGECMVCHIYTWVGGCSICKPCESSF